MDFAGVVRIRYPCVVLSAGDQTGSFYGFQDGTRKTARNQGSDDDGQDKGGSGYNDQDAIEQVKKGKIIFTEKKRSIINDLN